MAYNDFDLKMATQIAFLDVNPEQVKAHPEWTVRDHIANNPKLAAFIAIQQPGCMELYLNDKYGEWKIVDAVNNNGEGGSGFCACTIDTGDGNAIIGYRGSEIAFNVKTLVDDWVITDLGFLNCQEQMQQAEAVEYMERVCETYGDKYGTMSVTGHSLGGNLAEHATIMASDAAVSKLDRVVSFDGPGYSNEYLEAHSEQIAKRSGMIDHYQHSLVGSIMKQIPGTNYRCIAAHDDKLRIPILKSLLRHGTWNIEFDENGNVQDGTPDDYAIFLKGFTNAMDDYTSGPWYLALLEFGAIGLGLNEDVSFDDFVKKMNEYKSEYLAMFDQIPCEFKISTPKVESVAEIAGNVSRTLLNEAAEVKRIKSEVSLLLKAASFFTVSFKLGKSASNMEKLGNKSQKIKDVAIEASNTYSGFEKTITSNAEV